MNIYCDNCGSSGPNNNAFCEQCLNPLFDVVEELFEPMGKFSETEGRLIRERTDVIAAALLQQFDGYPPGSFDRNDAYYASIQSAVNDDPFLETLTARQIVRFNVLDELYGYGPLGPLLRDDSVAAIFSVGPSSVYIVKFDGLAYRTPLQFKNDSHFEIVVRRLAKIIDPNGPIDHVRGRLPNGTAIDFASSSHAKQPVLMIRTYGTVQS